jgi:hypothetical protein
MWEEVIINLEETIQEGESELLAKTQESLEAIQEAFSDTLNNIVEEFEAAVSGIYGSTEALQSAYD